MEGERVNILGLVAVARSTSRFGETIDALRRSWPDGVWCIVVR